MRKEYNETAQAFKERLQRVEKVLEDRTIDNTMAGKRYGYGCNLIHKRCQEKNR